MSAGRKYARYVRNQTGWWGAYPPQAPMVVGHIYTIHDGSPKYESSTFDWPGWSAGLAVEKVRSPGTLSYSAHASRTVTAAAAAQVPAGAPLPAGVDAEVNLEFSRRAGFVMDLETDVTDRYRDIGAVKKWILAAAKNGSWDLNYVLVTEVMHAESATIVISEDRNSTVTLAASTALPAVFSLADPKLGLGITRTNGSTMSAICGEATPLYQCLRVRKPWFRSQRAELLAASPGASVPDEAFIDEPFDDDV